MRHEPQIIPFREEFLSEAAAVFIANYKKQRQAVPILPDRMENTQKVVELLRKLFQSSKGIAAVENGRLTGYMGWFLIEGFRNTDRKGAYCPEWGHAVDGGSPATTYLAMYRAAAAQWHTAGCQVHALTLLANDKTAERFWFWNGFGMIVVDAIRSVQPLGVQPSKHLTIRRAELEDAEAIAILEAEHWRHYAEPPTLMAPQTPEDAAAYRKFLSQPRKSVWLALDGKEPAGYMRFVEKSSGAANIVESETTIAIDAAFTRPQYRGQGAAAGMLEAGLRYYGAMGYERCSVDFESINPEASLFWMKYFEPVCISVNRQPEI